MNQKQGIAAVTVVILLVVYMVISSILAEKDMVILKQQLEESEERESQILKNQAKANRKLVEDKKKKVILEKQAKQTTVLKQKNKKLQAKVDITKKENREYVENTKKVIASLERDRDGWKNLALDHEKTIDMMKLNFKAYKKEHKVVKVITKKIIKLKKVRFGWSIGAYIFRDLIHKDWGVGVGVGYSFVF